MFPMNEVCFQALLDSLAPARQGDRGSGTDEEERLGDQFGADGWSIMEGAEGRGLRCQAWYFPSANRSKN